MFATNFFIVNKKNLAINFFNSSTLKDEAKGF